MCGFVNAYQSRENVQWFPSLLLNDLTAWKVRVQGLRCMKMMF